MKKRTTILAIAIVLLMTIMTQTVFASSIDEHAGLQSETDGEVMPIFTGVINNCPSCGKLALYTCNGPNGTKASDLTCTQHANCVLQNRIEYKTKVSCQQCGLGIEVGGGDGFAGVHVESYTHSYTGVTHTGCIYNM